MLVGGLTTTAALAAPVSSATVPSSFACSAIGMVEPGELGAPYYTIELVPTGRVPGTRRAQGEARVAFGGSPFGVAVTAAGRYIYDVTVGFDGLPAPAGRYVVWLASADLQEIQPVGPLDADLGATASVEWNKFLVVVTLEPAAGELAASWTGPIVARGMSRSGRMHTMAGHGPFQAEPCAKYGY